MRKRRNKNQPYNIRKSEVTIDYTNGKEYIYYTLDSNQPIEYFGFYYTLKSGQVYMGADHTASPRIRLYNPPKSSFEEKNKMYYSLTQESFDRYSYPKYYYPEPTKEQYNTGVITRTFVQKRNELDIIIEVDPESPQMYNNSNLPGINSYLWKLGSIQWTISGNIKQVRKANQRILEKSNQNIYGILNYLGDLDEFHISKPIIKRQRNRSSYTDGEAVHGNLPQGYNQANVPGENCASCIFKNNNVCGLWQANIRNNYVCMRWKLNPY